MAELQRGVHGVSPPQRSPLTKVTVPLEGLCVGYHDDVLLAVEPMLQFCPFDFEMTRLGSDDARQGDFISPSPSDFYVDRRLKEILELLWGI